MKIYHGERTGEGCRVTVDGVPLRVRSDLSGAAAPFDWGYVGNGQLSLALLSDLLGDGQKAKALSEAFERRVVAELPRDAWTVTEVEFAAALETLAGADETAGAAGAASANLGGVGFGDMPIQTGNLVPAFDGFGHARLPRTPSLLPSNPPPDGCSQPDATSG